MEIKALLRINNRNPYKTKSIRNKSIIVVELKRLDDGRLAWIGNGSVAQGNEFEAITQRMPPEYKTLPVLKKIIKEERLYEDDWLCLDEVPLEFEGENHSHTENQSD